MPDPIRKVQLSDGDTVHVYRSPRSAPPDCTGMAPATPSLWVLRPDGWWRLEGRSVNKVAADIAACGDWAEVVAFGLVVGPPESAMSDLTHLARRLVALGYDMDDDGIRILYRCPAISDVVAGAVQCAENSHDIDDIIKGGVPGRPVEVIGPDLSHDGTLGVLLGAMGWPEVNLDGPDVDEPATCRLDGAPNDDGRCSRIYGEGPTRKHALAAALVDLAEARGGVVP